MDPVGLVDSSGLGESARSAFRQAVTSAREGKFNELAGRSMKRGPVKKPGAHDTGAQALYEEIQGAWERIVQLVGEYAGCRARTYYQPYERLWPRYEAYSRQVRAFLAGLFRRGITEREFVEHDCEARALCLMGTLDGHSRWAPKLSDHGQDADAEVTDTRDLGELSRCDQAGKARCGKMARAWEVARQPLRSTA